MKYYYKVFPNYARMEADIKRGWARPEDLRAGERIVIRYEFGDESVEPTDVDYAVVESLDLAQACRTELEALGFEVVIRRNDEPDPLFDATPKPRLVDLIAAKTGERPAEAWGPDEVFVRRRQRWEKSIDSLTNPARKTVFRIGQQNGWSLRDACPKIVVEPDHEGGGIVIVFDEFGRTEWLIDPSGGELLFSRTRRPSTKFFTW